MTLPKLRHPVKFGLVFLLALAIVSSHRLVMRWLVPPGLVMVPGTPTGMMAEAGSGNLINGQWAWQDKDHQLRSRADLDKILHEHALWIVKRDGSGARADLSGVDLNNADLHGAILASAILTRADLNQADLTNAHLEHAELTQADLNHANLEGARLESTKLDGARMTAANLSRGILIDASLRNTDLDAATLRYADLGNADLQDANLSGADVAGAVFEPKLSPEAGTMATANGLKLLTYRSNSSVLAQLRKQFGDGGFRTQERQITYALKRREAVTSWYGCHSRELPNGSLRPILWSEDSVVANCAAFLLNRIFFDLTREYGLSPGRPLLFGLVLLLLCSFSYVICIHTGEESALYRVYSENILVDPVVKRPAERIRAQPIKTHVRRKKVVLLLRRELRLFSTAMFFSLMSAFNIGFRDIDFGRWLRLLTRQEFDIKAEGWARVIAGWQSLLSVYLIALSVLTYFGRPFQ